MEGFEWLLEMRDGMTAPAATMKAALKSFSGQIAQTEREIRILQERQLNYKANGKMFADAAKQNADAIARLRLHMGELRSASSQVTDAMPEQGASMLGAAFGALSLVSALAMVARAEWDAVRGTAALTVEGIKLAVEMAELREHTIRMFEGLGGSAAIGDEMYRSLQRLRTELPQSEKELGAWAAKLMAAGQVDPSKVTQSIRAMASASALLGGGEQGAAAASKIGEMIARAQETGQLKGRGGAKALVGTGVTPEELAARLGMTPENFKTAFAKGTIDASKGIDALNAVLAEKGSRALQGTMGEARVMAAKAGEAWRHMFDGVDVKPLTDAFRQMVSVLDTAQPSGRAMKQTITSGMNDIIRVAGLTVRTLTLGFLYLEIGALKLIIALAPVIVLFRRWAKDGTLLDVMNGALFTTRMLLDGILFIAQQLAEPFVLAAAAANALHGAMGGDKPTGAGGADWGPAAPRAPANAAGGTVLPASGEVLASVAPGETIVPRGGFKAMGGSEAPAQAGKGNTDVDVDVGGVHFHGVSQKTAGELISMAESALADVLERAAMEAGTA